MRETFWTALEKIETWIDRPCCRNVDLVKRTFEGVEEDFCLGCGLYRRSPLRKLYQAWGGKIQNSHQPSPPAPDCAPPTASQLPPPPPGA